MVQKRLKETMSKRRKRWRYLLTEKFEMLKEKTKK